MKYSLFINQQKTLEWGLNTSEAILVDLFSHLPKWAEKYQIIDNEVWYFFSKTKISDEIPILGGKIDTIYRICKNLKAKGLLDFQKIGGKDFWKISEKMKEWDFIENSEENPTLGKKSDTRKNFRNNSEKFPTYNNTEDKINNISSNEDILSDSEKTEFFVTENEAETSHTDELYEQDLGESSAAESTKPKLGQNLEAGKIVRKTSSVSTKTAELNKAKAELKSSLLLAVGCDAFKDYAEWTELGKMLKLMEKIGKDQFLFRLEKVLEDPFKANLSNKLAYLRKEIECFIHSPVVAKKSNFSVGEA